MQAGIQVCLAELFSILSVCMAEEELAGMRLRAVMIVFVFALATIGSSHGADDTSSMVESLSKTYRGKSAMIRGFYCDPRLEYDSDGKLLSSAKAGPWTACGFVELKDFRLKDDEIEIKANRTGISFDEGKLIPIAGDGVKFRIRVPKDATAATIEKLLDVVFFDKQSKLIDAVPDYWKCYLSHPALEPKKQDCGSREVQKMEVFKNVKNVTAPRALSTKDPDYPIFARSVHLQGTVMVSVEINESGMVEDIHVTRAVGLGLEDSAVDAIKQWRFEPARLGTKPLSVQIPIEVNFYMGSKLKTLSDY